MRPVDPLCWRPSPSCQFSSPCRLGRLNCLQPRPSREPDETSKSFDASPAEGHGRPWNMLPRHLQGLPRPATSTEATILKSKLTDPAAQAPGGMVRDPQRHTGAASSGSWPSGRIIRTGPSRTRCRRRLEDALLAERRSPAQVRAYFRKAAPDHRLRADRPRLRAEGRRRRGGGHRPDPPSLAGGHLRQRNSRPASWSGFPTCCSGRPPLPHGAPAPEGKLGRRPSARPVMRARITPRS